jgi:hypothetical protein
MVLTAVAMNRNIVWDVMPCSAVEVIRRLGATYWSHLQSEEQPTSRRACCLLGLYFDPEGGSSTFL